VLPMTKRRFLLISLLALTPAGRFLFAEEVIRSSVQPAWTATFRHPRDNTVDLIGAWIDSEGLAVGARITHRRRRSANPTDLEITFEHLQITFPTGGGEPVAKPLFDSSVGWSDSKEEGGARKLFEIINIDGRSKTGILRAGYTPLRFARLDADITTAIVDPNHRLGRAELHGIICERSEMCFALFASSLSDSSGVDLGVFATAAKLNPSGEILWSSTLSSPKTIPVDALPLSDGGLVFVSNNANDLWRTIDPKVFLTRHNGEGELVVQTEFSGRYGAIAGIGENRFAVCIDTGANPFLPKHAVVVLNDKLQEQYRADLSAILQQPVVRPAECAMTAIRKERWVAAIHDGEGRRLIVMLGDAHGKIMQVAERNGLNVMFGKPRLVVDHGAVWSISRLADGGVRNAPLIEVNHWVFPQ